MIPKSKGEEPKEGSASSRLSDFKLRSHPSKMETTQNNRPYLWTGRIRVPCQRCSWLCWFVCMCFNFILLVVYLFLSWIGTTCRNVGKTKPTKNSNKNDEKAKQFGVEELLSHSSIKKNGFHPFDHPTLLYIFHLQLSMQVLEEST